jgi:L-asparaginase
MTGAQRPLSALRTDARRNLISAVDIAAHGPREVVGQVSVYFNDVLLQGNRSRKRSASEFAAFESPQKAPLAVVGTTIRYAPPHAAPAQSAPLLKPVFNRKVAMLQVTPGFPADAVARGLLPGLDGLVLIVFASVTAPTHDPGFLELLRDARRRDLPVVIVTESAAHAGAADPSANPESYPAGRQLIEEGCLWAGPMTKECAYVKTQLLLGQGRGRKGFARRWARTYASET